jgi:hypothetical protein
MGRTNLQVYETKAHQSGVYSWCFHILATWLEAGNHASFHQNRDATLQSRPVGKNQTAGRGQNGAIFLTGECCDLASFLTNLIAGSPPYSNCVLAKQALRSLMCLVEVSITNGPGLIRITVNGRYRSRGQRQSLTGRGRGRGSFHIITASPRGATILLVLDGLQDLIPISGARVRDLTPTASPRAPYRRPIRPAAPWNHRRWCACVLNNPTQLILAFPYSFFRLSVPFLTLQILFAFKAIVNSVSPSSSLVRIRSSMNSSNNEAYDGGTSPFQTHIKHRSRGHARYTAQAKRSFHPTAFGNEHGPSGSASLAPLPTLNSIQTEVPQSEAQQEPGSPSSGGSPALTPSTVLSDRAADHFGGSQEDSSLDENGSFYHVARWRGFSAEVLTLSTSRSWNDADDSGYSICNGPAAQYGPEERFQTLREINGHSKLKSTLS